MIEEPFTVMARKLSWTKKQASEFPLVADLLENKSLESVSAVLVGLVAANALWDLVGLARIGH